MLCQHQCHREGIRTYVGNIPSSAQGAYFPGDEPGDFCELNEQPCECRETMIACPECLAEAEIVSRLFCNGTHYICRHQHCGNVYEPAELLEHLSGVAVDVTKRCMDSNELYRELQTYEAMVKKAREALELY